MRKVSNDYSVTYSMLRNGGTILNKRKVACFRDLYTINVIPSDIILFEDFQTEETHMYAVSYLNKISKICGINITHIDENSISITNVKNNFTVRVFTTLYRILFETLKDYGPKNELELTNKIAFFEDFINKKTFCIYKDNLKRLIHFHNKNNIFAGPGHCIKSSKTKLLALKTSKELQEFKPTVRNYVQDFFTE